MRLIPITMTASLIAAIIGATATVASAQSCGDLWVERNTYYKQAGYCFKTARAISYFGNAGCAYDNERDVPLSRAVRARVNQIVALERAYRCPG
jgi:YARHG domain